MTVLRINCVDYLLKKLFFKLGLVVAKYPGYFIIVPVLVTIICITGFQRLHYVMDSEYLFSPENGASKTERDIIESYFKTNYSHRFNPTRITRPGTSVCGLSNSLQFKMTFFHDHGLTKPYSHPSNLLSTNTILMNLIIGASRELLAVH